MGIWGGRVNDSERGLMRKIFVCNGLCCTTTFIISDFFSAASICGARLGCLALKRGFSKLIVRLAGSTDAGSVDRVYVGRGRRSEW